MIRQGRRDITPEQIDKLVACFEQFKAEDDDRLDGDNVFVRTPGYWRVIARQNAQQNTVLLGRKGDGKSAIVRRFAHEIAADPASVAGAVGAERFLKIDMEETYFVDLISQFQILSQVIHSEYPNIPNEQISSKLWEKYLSLTAMQFSAATLAQLDDDTVSTRQRDRFAHLAMLTNNEIGAIARRGSADASQNFIRYLTNLVRKISISDTSIAEQLSAAESQSKDPLSALRDLSPEFYAGGRLIGDSGLQLTIALDKFDDFIDRLVSNDLSSTRLLRRHFLHGLVSSLYQIRRRPEFRWLRVIASLPEDLVVDLDLREIASHKRTGFVQISWSNEDLQNLLDNRVASVLPGTGWADLFPFQVSNANRRVQRKERSGDYMIRHTTRRPRELMAHARNLFDSMRTSGKPIDTAEMNRVIAETNREIVTTQVLREWRTVLPTLESFIQRLHRSEPKTVFSFVELTHWGASTVLVQSTLPESLRLSDDAKSMLALAALFRIGMVGFRVYRATFREGYIRQEDGNFARYVFSYSATMEPISDVTSLLLSPKLHELLDSDQYRAVRALLAEGRQGRYGIGLCFAPMFFESLNADHGEPYVIDALNEIAGVERDAA